jgi:hypothetical protein
LPFPGVQPRPPCLDHGGIDDLAAHRQIAALAPTVATMIEIYELRHVGERGKV